MRSIAVVAVVGLSIASSAGAQVSTSIVPAPGRTTWAPGLRQAVPARATICATLSAANFGNGQIDASAAIQQAVDACPESQTVLLSGALPSTPSGNSVPSTFLVNTYILINKGITLRGAGPGQTKLVKTNGAVPNDYHVADAQPLIVIGPNRWPKPNDATSVNLSTTVLAGAMSVTVANATGLLPGQFVLLDEDDYNTGAWLALPNRAGSRKRAQIWASDRVVFQRHKPSESTDDPFPASLTWFSRAGRPLNEIKEIASVSGNEITFTTPVHADYRRERFAQLTRYFVPHVKGAGVEDLAVSGGGDGNIRFESAAYSWAKNIESTLWVGEGVGVNGSFRVEVRDSLIHDTAWPYPGGAGYGLSMAVGSSEVLIENNAVLNVNKVIVVRSCGAGSVVGYNYMDNGFTWSDPAWVEVGLNASHQVGSHHVLFEGNEAWNYDSDNTHGAAFAMTVFRNHLVGRRRDFPGMVNARGAGLMFGSWWHSFIGNVIGEPNGLGTWYYEDPGDGSHGSGQISWGASPYVWKLGYDPLHWEQYADPKVRQTTLRDGNFDYLTNEVRWDRTARPLPASLYLQAKPPFFGDNPWPWVDPLSGSKLGVLPARIRPGVAGPVYVVPPAE